ncbi:hypothetical protein Q8F55_006204 [Vanrija albida]|uniref:DUF7330 domain-containing protein n=1 Tax=Vanrija albida TaxID=181172 RepID=A0ABR3PWK5_9TREE
MTSSKGEHTPAPGENQPDREYEVAHAVADEHHDQPHHDDHDHAPPPPTYEDVLSERVGSTTLGERTPPVSTRPTAPEDAQRAVAPLTLHHLNESIKGAYAVDIGENKAGPDVHLKSTNGALRVSVFLRGSVPRPAEVVLETTNGGVKALVDREPGQAVHFKATSTNGSVTVTLPRDFDGVVSLRSTNGAKNLADEIKAKSVIVPNEGGDSKTISYRVRPDPEDVGDGASTAWHTAASTASTAAASTLKGDDKDEAHAHGPDRADIRTTNGGVRVVYYDPEAHEEESKGCVIA